MPEDQLERVMMDFASGEYDVLISTTIIENGLDIPNANTIIVNNAAAFGLAQLYQLRGRVGRGTHQASAREGGHDPGRGGRIHAQGVADAEQGGRVRLREMDEDPELLRAEAMVGDAAPHRLLQAPARHGDEPAQRILFRQ